MRQSRVAGFTLPELVVAVFVLGLLSITIAPMLNSYVVSLRGSYAKKQEITNQTIGVALLNFASDSSPRGELPAPFTGNGYSTTVYNPADTSAIGLALTGALTQSGINPSEINDDNYSSRRVRVYQRVSGLSTKVPLAFQSGPQVTLTYQFGAIYMTACGKGVASCNPSPASGVPGASPAMSSANYSSWTTTGTDLPAYFVSSLPLQKQMLAGTNDKLNKIKDSLLSYFRAQQRTASGNDMTNWWLPNPGNRGGKTPGPNQGCRDGWYDLSADESILPVVGLTTTEYGRTAWGGPIEYCRDYDPAGTAPDTSPHLAALRIHSSVSLGSAPDPAVMNNNVVLTF